MSPNEAAVRSVLRTVLVVLLVVGVLALVWLLRRPISWLVLALFIAVAMSGPIGALDRHMRRGLAITIAYLGLLIVPLGVIGLVVPSVVEGVGELVDEVPRYVSDLQEEVRTNERLRELDQQYGLTEKLQEEAGRLPERFGTAATTLRDLGFGLVNSIFAGVTILILSVFMVSSGGRWVNAFIRMQRPDRAIRLRRSIDRAGNAVGAYVGGVLVQATIAGVTTFIVLSILGVPFAPALAVAMALLDAIPLIGATLGAVLIAVVTLFVDFPTTFIVWVVFAIVYQQVENTVIQPRIQSRAVDVHPFVVIVAVLFGSTLFGVAGALLAVPAAATFLIAGRELMDYRREVNAHARAAAAEATEPPVSPGQGTLPLTP